MNEIKNYTYNEVFDKTFQYFKGDDLATNVWISKYCNKSIDDNGITQYHELTPYDTHVRLAKEFYRAGQKYNNPISFEEILELFENFKYIIPQGRPMAGIGVMDMVSLSNCFVVGKPGQDSYGTIALVDQQIMQLSKRGGGVGSDISEYRPHNAKVTNAAKTSSGPVEICAKRFSNTIREVGQCIEENQRVLTQNRGLVPIKDIEIGEYVWTKIGYVKVTNKFNNGKKECFKVKTKNGYEIITSENHIFHSSNENGSFETELKNFKINDYISILLPPFNKTNDSELNDINEGIMIRENIKSIEKVDEYNTYDLELEEEHLFWCEGFYVHNSGRRGALMISMDVTHPDAEKFIDAKTKEGEITGANISVKVYDDWMRQVVNNSNNKDEEKERLWKKLISNSARYAEPGLLYWSTIIKESVPDCYKDFGYTTFSTNPCQPKWATVLTQDGIKTFGEIEVGDMIWSSEGWTKIIRKQSSGIKNVYEYKTTAGAFNGTDTHRIVSKGEKIEVKDADSIDILGGNIVLDKSFDLQSIVDGLVIGDGSVHKASNNLIYLCIGENVNDYFTSEISNLIKVKRNGISPYAYEVKTLINYNELPLTFLRSIPERYFKSNNLIVRSFLRGLFSANGSVVGKRVTLKTSSQKIRDEVQIMLSSVGIRSYYTINKSKEIEFSNGNYISRESYDINISTDREIFYNAIGFIQKYKMDKLFKTFGKIKNNTKTYNIISNNLISAEEVFNITVDNNSHTYWTGGLNVSNCGEIPLSPYDSCRLMLLNLVGYIENPFTDKAEFNFKKFSSHSKKIMKLMDNMIDLEVEKIDRIIAKVESDPEDEITKTIELDLWKNIKKTCLLGRRSGIGITAEGDMLAMMGLKYGTKEATEFALKVQKILSLSCYIESCDLVQRDGREKFGCFDWSLEAQNPFLNRLITLDEQDTQDEFLTSLKEEFKDKWKNGRRNIALLTIAPSGSISCLTQTTSGIENLFLPYYKRKRKIDKKEGVKPDFVDKTGDWFEEFNVIHYPIIQWYSIKEGISFEEAKANLEKMPEKEFDTIFEESPYYGATSNNCNWVEKVKMQGAIQKYIDHSISVTVNLPKGTTEELVRDVYETAWIEGCKGCTIYVDGSRDGVLTAKSDKNKNCDCKGFRETDAPRRPKTLPCKVVRFSNNKEKWVALVGLMEGKPYELFTGLLDKLNIPNNINEGIIVKNKMPKEVFDDEKGKMVTISVSRYDFVYKTPQGEELKVEGINTVFDKKYWDFGKLISGNLRHGMPIEFLVKILTGLSSEDDAITSWKMGVVRTLKSFLKDGETGEVCPDCGKKLTRESGCVGCKFCGFSKCG